VKAETSNLKWFTSSRSANGQSCVECARTLSAGMAVRDTKHRDGAVLSFGKTEWDKFLQRVHAGDMPTTT
jgi:hypothetical protein